MKLKLIIQLDSSKLKSRRMSRVFVFQRAVFTSLSGVPSGSEKMFENRPKFGAILDAIFDKRASYLKI